MSWLPAAEEFTNALSAPEPTPGGGAAAAMAGAMGCALLLMAVGTTLKRKHTPAEDVPLLKETRHRLQGLHSTLKKLIGQDADAYTAYMHAAKLPKETPSRPQAVQDALWFAATVPADTAATCQQVLQVLDKVQGKIAPIIKADVFCARHLLRGAILCALENVRANLSLITDEKRIQSLTRILENYEPDRN